MGQRTLFSGHLVFVSNFEKTRLSSPPLQDALQPDLVIFASLFSACASSARAEQLLQRMGRERLEMNLVLRNAVINRDLLEINLETNRGGDFLG